MNIDNAITKIKTLRMLLVLYSALLSNLCLAQKDDSVRLNIKVVRSSDIISSDLSMIFQVTNNSPKSLKFQLDSVTIILPGEISSYYKINKFEAVDQLNSGATLIYVVPFVALKQEGFISWVNLATFLPRQFKITILVTYHEFTLGQVDRHQARIISAAEDVYFRPPLGSLLFGGVAGSLLLATFITFYRFKNITIDKGFLGKLKSKGIQELAKYIVLFCFGALVSVITILVIQRTSELALPISLKVEDYLGGIIVGMLSMKLGDTLYKMFI